MPNKTIAFFIRHFGERGTEQSVYNYAHFNETILGNRSLIIAFTKEKYARHGLMFMESVFNKFKSRFQIIQVSDYSEVDEVLKREKVDAYYTQTQGLRNQDEYPFGIPSLVRTVVHCVFNTTEKHGDLYIPINDHLNKHYKTNYPVLPYMVTVAETTENLRENLNIPKDAIVYGRHGGYGQFGIDFVKEVVAEHAIKNPNTYFLFLNTQPFTQGIKNIIYLPMTIDEVEKRKFINTCDAMIHARPDGETFGLSVGEFAICEKPILTWAHGFDNAHLDILNEKAIVYSTKEDLAKILQEFKPTLFYAKKNGYMEYTPEKVMKIFDRLVCSS